MTIQCNKEVEIATIQSDVAHVREKIDEMHVKLMGNGKEGVIDKLNRWEGSIATWKFIAGSGFILSILKFFIK